ncbi:putative nuclease HARBI1 [Heptranchias perlo]|uniref:putative nuclease HARBI1 n=1 Tax=Heptranchias perlo TaxID=212740 RepID=UPI00355A304E
MPAGPSGHVLLVAVKVTASLNLFASGSFQAVKGDNICISQSAVYSCNKQLTDTLYVPEPAFSLGASTENERVLEFAAMVGFLCVHGVVDYTHVTVKAPEDELAAFINRKGYHTINAQLMCDHCRRIMQVSATFAGRCHNAFIVQPSTFPPLFHPSRNVNEWLLPWLMTRLHNSTTPEPLRYNQCLGTTSTILEHTAALLIQRFRCMDGSGGSLQYAPHKACRIIVMCCMLQYIERIGWAEQQEESSSDAEELDEGAEEGG